LIPLCINAIYKIKLRLVVNNVVNVNVNLQEAKLGRAEECSAPLGLLLLPDAEEEELLLLGGEPGLVFTVGD